MSSTIPVTAIGALLGRYTNSVVNEQAEENAPLLKNKIIEKLNKKDKLGVVNVKAGELASIKFLADGGTLPQGADILPQQGTYFPVALFGRVKIPRLAANTATSKEDAVDIVMEQLDTTGKTMGRQLNRSVYGHQIGSPASTVAAASTTFEVADSSAWRVGMSFEVWNGSSAIEGTSEATLCKVSKVARPVDGVGNTTITFTTAGGAGNLVQWETTYTFHIRGSKASGATMVSLADAYSGSASLYGISADSFEWSGNSDSSGKALTVGNLRSWLTEIIRRRGEEPTAILANRKNIERYGNQMINQRRFMNGTMDAVGKQVPEFEGLPFQRDENLKDSELFMFNRNDIKLHVFRDIAPDFDGNAKKSMGREAMLISDSEFVYDLQVWGAYNLRVERRNGGGLYNITG
jgi:hypothetical protein